MKKATLQKQHADCSGCPLAHALDIIGDKWTLLIVREIMMNNLHEYSEFQQIPEGIASNILSNRLKKLQQHSVIGSIPHPENKKKKLYFLTEKGIDLIPAVFEFIMWSIRNNPLPPHPKIEYAKKNHKKMLASTIEQVRKWNKQHIS